MSLVIPDGNQRMRHSKLHDCRSLARCAFALGVIFLITAVGASQTSRPQIKEATAADTAISQALNKYPGLLSELGHLFERLKHDVQFPAERHQSDLLPRLPASTSFYAAFPNYGEPAHQALMTFRDELKQSAVLQNWWQQSDMAKAGPQIESSIEKFYELSEYLGDEMVVSGEADGPVPSVLFVTGVRKPGLKNFLQQMLKDLPDRSTSTPA